METGLEMAGVGQVGAAGIVRLRAACEVYLSNIRWLRMPGRRLAMSMPLGHQEHITRAAPGIEPGTSRTLSENHATRTSSQVLSLNSRMQGTRHQTSSLLSASTTAMLQQVADLRVGLPCEHDSVNAAAIRIPMTIHASALARTRRRCAGGPHGTCRAFP